MFIGKPSLNHATIAWFSLYKKTTGRNLSFFLAGGYKKDIFAALRINSNFRKMMHRLRRYDVLRCAQYDVKRSLMLRSNTSLTK